MHINLIYFRYEVFSESFVNVKLFAEIFHDLCDGIQQINNLFAIHLVPILLAMLIVDIFGMFGIFKYIYIFQNAFDVFSTFVIIYYIIKHYILRAVIAHIGSTTTCEPEKLIEMIAKLINKLSFNHLTVPILRNYIKEFQTRNFKLKTLFLTINWNILLGVRQSINDFNLNY